MRYNAPVFVAGLLAAICLAGCSGREELPEAPVVGQPEVRAAIVTADSALTEAVLFADPQAAVEAIIASLDTEPSLSAVEKESLEDVFGILPEDVEDVVAYISNPKMGLADIAIILPAQGSADRVREALMQYAALRAESFKNYDILGAYSIAQGTTVFSQGDYTVMLMLSDNEAAGEILDQYMPR